MSELERVMKGEMMPIKDQQIRREYFKAYMANRRKGLTNPNSVKPENKLNLVKPPSEVLNPELAKPVKPLASVKPENVKSQLWSSHYSVQKPYCHSCQQKGIPETHYAFCSLEKVKDALSVRLPNRYVCNVYHWTLYQGQGKLGGIM